MKYFYLLILLFVLSCSKTEKKMISEKELQQQNVAFIIDNSITMISKDFEPDKITVVKKFMENIVNNKKENQAFSIVVFAENSYILCPLTKDKDVLLSAINKLNLGIFKLKPGTNFSNALLNGISSLKAETDNKSMVLITDGNENRKSFPLHIPVEDAIKNNIAINSIIITPKDYQILPESVDSKGNWTFQKLKTEPIDIAKVQDISSKTGGKFNIFYTKEEFLKLDFQKLINETLPAKNIKIVPQTNDEQLNKIYEKIKISNDSLAIKFIQN
ncbi:vWA domain-containing protein [Chryseobacterium oryctis]|uniref:VWA domain-containing protein n=1 Tax=Chryseobacterium oryctis TaxID=2952618 RepID=A0ABT3HPN2_9FLAO|nr:VWA domain-containing protein [Chryseobacterium oryctis]MCW3161578.1 VWA domain-containing protein [Chryseobacterium oryctis]